MQRLICTLPLIIFASLILLLFIGNRLNLTPNSVTLEISSPVQNDTYRIFYDIGYGFRKSDSLTASILRQEKDNNLISFQIPVEKIYGLRIDPGNQEGNVTIKAIKFNHIFHRLNFILTLYQFPLKNFEPLNDISDFILTEDGLLRITSTGDAPSFVSTGNFHEIYRSIAGISFRIKITIYILTLFIITVLLISIPLEHFYSRLFNITPDEITQYAILKIKEKPFLISLVFFIIAFLFFSLRNYYYLPPYLQITGTFDTPVYAKLIWKTDDGVIDSFYESTVRLSDEVALTRDMHTFRIEALGEHNPEAGGSEVWILRVIKDDKIGVNLKEFNLEGNTLLNSDGQIVLSSSNDIATYTGEFFRIRVSLMKHPWSGKVKISIDEHVIQIKDLYSKNNICEDVEITGIFVPGSSIRKFKCPGVNIKGLTFFSLNPEHKFYLKEAKFCFFYRDIILPVNNEEYISEIEFNNIELHNEQFHPTLFVVHILLSAILSYILYMLLTLPCRVNQPDWKNTFIYIFFKEKHWVFWIMFFVSFFVFSLWLLGQWPGVMTPDSFDSWEQLRAMGFCNRLHPYVYTFYILFLKQFIDSPATVSIFQILLISLFGSFVFYFCIKNNLKVYLVIPFFLLFIFSVPAGIYNLILWKDIPFSFLIVFWAFLFFYMSYRKKRGQEIVFNLNIIILLAFLFIYLCMVRFNGIIYIVFLPFLLAITGLMPGKVLRCFLLISFFFFICLRFILPPAIGVTGMTQKQSSTKYIQLEATSIVKGMAKPDMAEYVSKKTYVFLETLSSMTNTVYHNNIKTEPKVKFLYDIQAEIMEKSFQEYRLIIWNAFIPLLILIMIFMLYRWLPCSALYCMFILFQALAMFFVSHKPAWRYIYFIYLSGFFIFPLVFLELKYVMEDLYLRSNRKAFQAFLNKLL